MSEAVKRNYASALRAEQARATRRAIVTAAAQLFIERGYGATTIDAIAAQAGVSRKTVFTSVGGKVEALKLARDWAIAGDDEPVPIMERPQVKRAQAERDARQILRSYAGMVRERAGRAAGIQMVIESAAGSDPAVAALAEEGRQQRLTGMLDLAGELVKRGALRSGISRDEAADVLWLFNDARVYHRLVTERRWSPERFEAWLADTLIGALLRRSYRPGAVM